MISIVIPAYNEASNLKVLQGRISAAFNSLPEETFECVIVDDGSADESARILKEMRAADPRFEWIRLLKNSGSHEAIGCGLKACRGDAAIVLAADLQDPPELFREILSRWRSGAKVVWAVRQARPGETLLNKAASQLYYRVMNLLLPTPFPLTGADFFLADRQVIEALALRYRRHAPNILFQVASLGFSSAVVGYVKRQRHSGKSKWGFRKRFYLFVDSVLEFSSPLLRLTTAALLLAAASLFVYQRMAAAAAAAAAMLGFYVWRLSRLFKAKLPIAQESSLRQIDRTGVVRGNA